MMLLEINGGVQYTQPHSTTPPASCRLLQDLSREVLSVTSLADVAVLVLSAATGEWEAAVESGRVKEIALDTWREDFLEKGREGPAGLRTC